MVFVVIKYKSMLKLFNEENMQHCADEYIAVSLTHYLSLSLSFYNMLSYAYS